MDAVQPGARQDIGKSGSASTDLSRHDPREGLKFEHGINVEVGECSSSNLWIADIGTVECEHSFDATLAIDRELLRKVRSTTWVRCCSRCQ